MQPRSRGRRFFAVVAAALVFVVLSAAPASAHVDLVRSDPSEGGQVDVGRETLTLWLSEPITVSSSNFELRSTDGIRAPITYTIEDGDPGSIVTFTTGQLWRATFILEYSVLSQVDGHVTRGAVLFGAGMAPVVTSKGGERLPAKRDLVLRWVDLSALVAVIGSVVVSRSVLGKMGPAAPALTRKAQKVALVSATVALAAGLVTPYVRIPRFDRPVDVWFSAVWRTMVDTSWGRLWGARELALLVATLALLQGMSRRKTQRDHTKVVLAALGAVVVLEGWVGHSAALPRQTVIATIASAAHLAAAGIWAGGLAVLAWCLIPLMIGDRANAGHLAMSAWRRFSPLAASATVVLLASGTYLAGRHLPTFDATSTTLYGESLRIKAILMAGALTLALGNTLIVNPWASQRARQLLRRRGTGPIIAAGRMRYLIAGELAVLVIAGLAASVITSVSTPRELESAELARSAPKFETVDGVFVTFEVLPAGPDASRLVVKERAITRPAPAQVDAVTIELISATGQPDQVALEPIEPGRYEIETTKLTPGVWDTTITLTRGGEIDPVIADFTWTIPEPIANKTRPFEWTTTILATLLILATAIALTRHRTRRPGREPVFPRHVAVER